MNEQIPPEIERELTAMTTWQGPAPELLQRALENTTAAPSGIRSRLWRPLSQCASAWALTGIAAVVIVAVSTSLTPHLSRSRELANRSSPPLGGTGNGIVVTKKDWTEEGRFSRVGGDANPAHKFNDADRDGYADASRSGPDFLWSTDSDPSASSGGGGGGRGFFGYEGANGKNGPAPEATQSASSPSDTRQVIHKASIELSAPDVRAAFLKAQLLISEAGGEFIQDSSITGTDPRLEAQLTLRVSAARLSTVLNGLRDLGKVQSERNIGEDVTAQVVDLEARLSNERRVETELQKLLETRQNAALKDILDLRDKLSQVRGTIEQLTAQRQRLSKLVSLATVLVIIRASDAPPPAKEQSLGEYFLKAVGAAWSKGLTVLMDTAAGFVAVLVGGAIWWLALIVVIVITRRAIFRVPVKS